MKIQIVSDLHIEYLSDDNIDPLKIITPSAEILVLAGDIGSLYKLPQLRKFLTDLSPHFKLMLYVLGNHEFYYYNDSVQYSMKTLYQKALELRDDIPNLVILNRNSVIIGNTCICGATLWSKPDIKIPKYIIRINGISNEVYENMHNKDLAYIESMIDYCDTNNLKLVVVTHYPPTKDVLGGTEKRNISLYVNNLDHLLSKDRVSTWICGHVHRNFDFTSPNGTRLIGNQIGKPRENINTFIKYLTMEL